MNFGIREMVVIGIVFVVLFWGPAQLPKFGRSLGDTIKEIKGIGKAWRETKTEVDGVAKDVEREVKDATRS